MPDSKLEQAILVSKPSPLASIKGKKALARSRVLTKEIGNRVESSYHQVANMPFLFTSPPNCAIIHGRPEQGVLVKAQFTHSDGANMGTHCTGNSGRELDGSACQIPCLPDPGLGLVQSHDAESMGDDSTPCVEGSVLSMVGVSIESTESERGSAFGLGSHTQNFCNPDDNVEVSGMGLEGGGKAFTSC